MVRHHNEGHGRRLTAAFEALEAFPVLAESRNRVLRLFAQERPATADVVTAVESDVALAIATLRLANRVDGRARGRVDSVVRAVSVLSPAAVQALASRARTFDFFERSGIWEGTPERFRLHGVATQRAADRLAAELGYEERDRLMITSLLHDVGKLVPRWRPRRPGRRRGSGASCRRLLVGSGGQAPAAAVPRRAMNEPNEASSRRTTATGLPSIRAKSTATATMSATSIALAM